MTFEIMTKENTARITLNDNLTGHSETWLVGDCDVKSVAYAVLCFAKQQRIEQASVGYSVVYPVS